MAIQAARDNILGRAPRYLAGGMDPNDFYGVAEKVDTWDDWMNGVQALARARSACRDIAAHISDLRRRVLYRGWDLLSLRTAGLLR